LLALISVIDLGKGFYEIYCLFNGEIAIFTLLYLKLTFMLPAHIAGSKVLSFSTEEYYECES
jgi:hypothetical protein